MSARPFYQNQIGQWIVNAEGRRDGQGKLKVYKLPSGDGGGAYEIAGINDRYHPEVAGHLRELIELGGADEAEGEAVDYILRYTDLVLRWGVMPGVEAFLRDCCFNRGPGGAGKILQMAVGETVDGHVGPKTRAAVARHTDTRVLLQKLLRARESYERKVAPPVGARAKFWKGLQNRWAGAFDFAWTLV